MENKTEQDLKQLEAYVDELVVICERLRKENRDLREEQKVHLSERAILLEKHESANTKIEAMIERLKSIEDIDE